jgi:tRNA (guanine-N7-)-methyltransferase
VRSLGAVSEEIAISLSRLEPPLEPARIFGRIAPLEVEIGCGKGLFLTTTAASRPAHDFVGIEISSKYYKWAGRAIAREGLANVRLVREEAKYFVERYLAVASIRCLHVYYPDPWPKRRHWRRRLFDKEFVRLASDRLEPGGELRVATDHEDYWSVIERELDAEPDLERVDRRGGGEEIWGAWQTNFGRKYALERRATFRGCYRRAGTTREGASGR